MLGVPLTSADWGIWPINWRIIGKPFWKLSCVPKSEWWECVNILNFFFFAITLQVKNLSFLNSSSKWLEKMWDEGRSYVMCGRGAALALRCWVAKTPHGDAQGCASFRPSSMVFPNGDWTLLKSTFLLLPVSHSQHFSSVQFADMLNVAGWLPGEDFWGAVYRVKNEGQTYSSP